MAGSAHCVVEEFETVETFLKEGYLNPLPLILKRFGTNDFAAIRLPFAASPWSSAVLGL